MNWFSFSSLALSKGVMFHVNFHELSFSLANIKEWRNISLRHLDFYFISKGMTRHGFS